jgi:ATP-binding cassette subfamily C protein CydCD
VIPAAGGLLAGIAGIIADSMLHAPAVPLLIADLAVCLFVAPAVAVWADRRASRSQALLRSEVASRFAALVGAAGDLRANGVDGAVRADLASLDRDASAQAQKGAWALGAGHAIVVFASCATAVLMLIASFAAVRAGTLPGEIVAVLALLPLGLLEPLRAVVDAVQQWPTLSAALRKLAAVTDAESLVPAETAGQPLLGPIASLELDGLAARWPGAQAPAFDGVSLSAKTGDWVVVQGPSGSGKSTLVSTLLGYLTPASGSYCLDGMDATTVEPASLRTHLAWSPQEGHLFDSTIRANLLLARRRGDAPSEAEMVEVLRRVGLGALLGTLRDGLDARVGAQGSQLSGGQRQRLAVARTLLTRADIVLLDEPTAHLDREAAASLIADLRSATDATITVLVTHHSEDLRDSDTVVHLGARSSRADTVLAASGR